MIIVYVVLIASILISLIIYIIGLFKNHPWLGFGLGFVPLIVLWLLLILSNKPGTCAPPDLCEGTALGYFLFIGVTVLYVVTYLGSSSVIYLIHRYMYDQRHAIIHKPIYKAIVLSEIFFIVLLGIGIVIYKPMTILNWIVHAAGAVFLLSR